MTESDAGKDVVNAFVKNTALGNNEEDAKWKSVPCNFIAKVWKSGMVDLYVYLQTTNTYYIPHMKYAGNCQSSDDFTVKVNGRDLKTNIRDNYTTIKLTILDTVFDIDSVFENTIKGNSLPLKVFKLNDDLTDAEEEKAKMYHSYVQPSVAMAEEIRPVQYDRYQMMYYCFGSDAQAIKITFFDSKQNYDLPYKSVVYHGNGGYSIFDGRDTVTQRIIQGDGEKELYSDGMCFDNGDAIFVGWSVSRKGEIGDVIDFNTIDYDDITGKSLHLYAVWNRYRFGNMDTQLTIDTEEGETYTISEMEVDPNAQPGNGNQKLGNHIIMDWDN